MGINALKCKLVDLYSNQVSNKLKEGKLLGSVQVSLKLSIINPIYGAWLVEFYNYMISAKGKKYIYSGWRASGVTDAVHMCKVNLPPIDPFNDHDSLPLSTQGTQEFDSVIAISEKQNGLRCCSDDKYDKSKDGDLEWD